MIDPLSRMTGLSLDAFADSHWGVAPLVRRAAQLPIDGFADLLSLADVDELVSQRGLRTPFVRMSRDGDILNASRYTRSGGAGAEIGDQVADDKILAEFAAGATLVLQGMHRMWPPLVDFTSALATQLGHPAQVNAYITPPQNTGFAAHYDVHDVFVLQFAGSKRWHVHEPVWPLPLRDQPWTDRKPAVAARATQAPLIETVLECGDMLYLPRGYVHSATSLGDVSGHLTVGVHPITRRSLLDQVFAQLGDDLDVRRALPLGVDLAEAAVLDAELQATIGVLRNALERLDRVAVARAVGKHLAAMTRPAALRPLEQLAAAAALDEDQRVCLRPGLRFTVRNEGEHVLIGVADRTVRLPSTLAEAARAAMSGIPISAVELPSVNKSEGLDLLVRLLREGIVVRA